MSEVNYEYDWVGEERDFCDYSDMDCVGNHDCINCWFMHEMNSNLAKQLEKDEKRARATEG